MCFNVANLRQRKPPAEETPSRRNQLDWKNKKRKKKKNNKKGQTLWVDRYWINMGVGRPGIQIKIAHNNPLITCHSWRHVDMAVHDWGFYPTPPHTHTHRIDRFLLFLSYFSSCFWVIWLESLLKIKMYVSCSSCQGVWLGGSSETCWRAMTSSQCFSACC